MRRAWILPALALACTVDNPGFLLAGGTGSPTTGTSETSPSSMTATITGTATTGEPLPVCPLHDPSEELRLDLRFFIDDLPLVPPAGCPNTTYRGNGELSTNNLTMFDDGKCNDTLDGDFKLEVGYVGISLPILTGCFQVDVAWKPDCSAVRSAVLSGFVFGQRYLLAIGVVGSELPPFNAPDELVPQLQLLDACTCDPAATSCCEPEAPGPGSYALAFDALGVELGAGASAKVTVGDASYNLKNLRSHAHADCIDAPLHLDWYAAGAQ